MSRRRLLLTPGFTGADGISTLARLVATALRPQQPGDVIDPLDVVSLEEPVGFTPTAECLGSGRFFGAGRSTVRFAALVARAARLAREAPEIICLHLHLGPAALPLLALGARLTTILCGIEAWKPLRKLERLALRGSTNLLAISHHTAQRFRGANRDFAHRHVGICHPGVPDSRSASSAPPAHPLDEPFVLIVARMKREERYKGHDLLLDVWPDVLAQVPEATLVNVGDGDDRERLEARVAAMNLTHRIRFTGRVPDDELEGLYRRCAFFAMPSPLEGFGLVFLEAMRAGKACLGGLGAAEEVIEDGVTGVVVDPEKPGLVLDALLRLLRDPEARMRMGRAGGERFRANFTDVHFRRRLRGMLGIHPETGVVTIRSYGEACAEAPVASRLRRGLRHMTLDLLSRTSPESGPENAIRFPFYHHVFDDERRGFEEQLRTFKDWGTCISLAEAIAMLRDGRVEGRYFCLTFDDGYANLYHNAAPILERLEVPATFLLTTDAISVGIDRPEHPMFRWQDYFPRLVEFLDWEMCRDLAGRGFEFGSHSSSHAHLPRCTPEELHREIVGSRRRVEEEVGRPCRYFSCPWGTASHYNAETVRFVRDAGYECFLTARRGPNGPGDSPFEIRRDHIEPLWPVRHVRYFMSRHAGRLRR